MTAQAQAPRVVVIGRVAGVFGVRGWIKVYSYTEPRADILRHREWLIRLGDEWQPQEMLAGREHGKGLVAKLKDYDSPETARALVGADIGVFRAALPALGPDEFYWADLEGLRVVTREGAELGVVDHLFETGANDVLVVCGERERLLPYVRGEVILEIDLEQGVMRVDWDPEF